MMEWIPVSEHLPDKDTTVLIRVHWQDTVLCTVASIPHGSTCWLLEFPFSNPKGWQYLTENILAWMPIPEYSPSNAMALLTEDKTLVPNWATPDEGQF